MTKTCAGLWPRWRRPSRSPRSSRRGQGGVAPSSFGEKDHIAIIGNTLAERMQYDGWLETMLHARFPKHELVVRNLGFSGDEIATRLRSKNFGTPDEWLSGRRRSRSAATRRTGSTDQHQGRRHLRVLRLQRVVRRTGRARGVQEAADRLDHAHARAEVQRQDRAAARAVLADRARGSGQSRSAGRQGEQRAAGAVHERDGRGRQGARTSRSSICSRRALKLYAEHKAPLTIQGIHLNSEGNRRIAQVIDRALFGDPPRRIRKRT